MCERGEIYYYDFGTHQNSSVMNGIRPALIVSNNINNQNSTCINVVPLTTHEDNLKQIHIEINSIEKKSFALCEQVTTIRKSDLGYKLGRATKTELAKVSQGIILQLCGIL